MTGLAKAAGVAKPDGTFPRLKSALVVEGAGAIAGWGLGVVEHGVHRLRVPGIGEGPHGHRPRS